jgi:hypothetical protein
MNPHYELPVWDTIKASWSKVYGSKGTFWIAIVVAFIVIFALGMIDGVLKSSAPTIEPIYAFVMQVVTYLIDMGIVYLGIRRAMDLPIAFDQMFRGFQGSLPWKIIGLYILQVLICILPIILMVTSIMLYPIFGTALLSVIFFIVGFFGIIYLSVRLMMSMGYVLDKEMGPVDAIKASFHATGSNFWNLVAIFLIQTIILAILALPLGIGLIWGLPFAFINYGMIYKSISAAHQIQ